QEHGDIETSIRILEEIEATCRVNGNERALADVLTNLGWVRSGLGDNDVARIMSNEAMEIHERLGNKRGIATAVQNLGMIEGTTSNFVEGCRLLERNLQLRRELGDRRGIAYALD